MKKLNILFTNRHDEISQYLASMNMNSKSEIARAAMSIGLSMINSVRHSMTDREFYQYVLDCQDIDESMDPVTRSNENA